MTTTERQRLYDAMMHCLDEDGHTGTWKHRFITEYIDKVDAGQDITHINRLELINHANNDRGIGRLITLYKSLGDFEVVELDYQDGGKTLKIFLS